MRNEKTRNMKSRNAHGFLPIQLLVYSLMECLLICSNNLSCDLNCHLTYLAHKNLAYFVSLLDRDCSFGMFVLSCGCSVSA